MKTIISLILLGLVYQVNAQILLKGQVIDSITKEIVIYVNIGIIELSRGTVSNSYGQFNLKANSENDLITFSSIGYESINIRAKDLKNLEVVKLKRKDYEIEIVEIQSKRYKDDEVMLGVKNKERGHSIGFGSAQFGTEIASAIKIDKPTYIKSANFVLNHAQGDSVLFRVNIYEFNEGKIGENLLTANVFIKEKQRKGIISIDLSKYNLILESDVLLSLEWLRNFDETGNKGITFDTKKSKELKGIYVKYSSNGEFQKLTYKKKLKPCFYLLGKQTK